MPIKGLSSKIFGPLWAVFGLWISCGYRGDKLGIRGFRDGQNVAETQGNAKTEKRIPQDIHNLGEFIHILSTSMSMGVDWA